MNLLGAALYDPGTAASKATTSLLAMTAFDTTNLRIAFTVPAHGMVRVRIACVHTGSTTIAQVLLGVLEGSTVRARVPCNVNLLQTAIATSQTLLWAEFTVTGLSAGAVNWDAAYGVEIVASANGAIKYGGPNNTTTNDAWGAFVFEVWDPRPLKTGLDGGVNVTQYGGNAGTFSGGRPEVNASHIGGSAISQSGGVANVNVTQISGDTTSADNLESYTDGTTPQPVNVTQISGDATAADNAEAFFDGTGYAGTNNVIPTVTTAVNVTTVNGLAANVITAAATASDFGTEIAAAVWDRLTSALTTVGSIGKLLVDNINATISSRSSHSAADVWAVATRVLTAATNITSTGGTTVPQTGDSFARLGAPAGASVSADIASVKSDSAAILVDTAEIGAAGAGLTALGDARLANLDAAVSTRAPSATALSTAQWTNGRAGNLDNLDALISSRLASGSYTAPNNAGIAAIKLQTDKFTFTVPNAVDVNIEFVNGVELNGDGSATPWGP